MLVLTRRIGEVIIVGDDIKVIVLSIKGNQISFGIDAPENVSVHREEIYDKIKKNSKEEEQKIHAKFFPDSYV